MNFTHLEVVVNLLLAALLGGIVGAQRQATHKPAGFRTHLLVALGSCTFMELSRLAGDSRIAAGVITGVGFLGAGSIVREGLQTRGLTTAASIWAVSAIGLALGFGSSQSYVLGAATTILTLGALIVGDKGFDRLFPPKDELEVQITFDLGVLSLDGVADVLAQHSLIVRKTKELTIAPDGERRVAIWKLFLEVGRPVPWPRLVDVASAPGVVKIDTLGASAT